MTASRDEGRKPGEKPADKSTSAGPQAGKSDPSDRQTSAKPSSAPAKPGPAGSSALAPSATATAPTGTAPKPSEPLKTAPASNTAETGGASPAGSGAPKPAAGATGRAAQPVASAEPPLKPAATGSSVIPPGAPSKSSEPPKPEAPAKAAATGSAAIRPEVPKSDAKPGSKPDAVGATGNPGGASTASRVGAGDALADGPILDLKAKRLPDPAAAKSSEKAGTAGSGPTPKVGPGPENTGSGPSYGLVAASGLIGGVVGAGLLYALAQGGALAPDTARVDALDRTVATLAPRDALAALDKRVGANEQAVKPLTESVKTASERAEEALRKAGAPAASAEGATLTSAVPADLAARLDALDQRVSALQEEPGREQPAGSAVATTQAGDEGKRFAAFDERLKALESKAETGAAAPAPPTPSPEVAEKLASLQSGLDARAKAEQALGERLDQSQQTLDARVKSATEAVQSATDASRQAAEASKVQVEEAAKGIDRRLQEQGERLAALDKAVDASAKAATVQAALRIVAADRIGTALEAGTPYSDALESLRATEAGDGSALAPLGPFAESGAPTAASLASAFRPVREKAATARRTAKAKTVAETGSLTDRLQSMASSIVQVRKTGEAVPAAGASASDDDPLAKVQDALDRGSVGQAAQAFAALPEDVRTEIGDVGAKLKARAEADAAVRALQVQAFKSLSAPAAGR